MATLLKLEILDSRHPEKPPIEKDVYVAPDFNKPYDLNGERLTIESLETKGERVIIVVGPYRKPPFSTKMR